MYEYCSYFPLQEGWRIPTFAKMQILGRISQISHATVTPRGIILKSWRESTVVNAVWQVSVIFTALPWRGLMEREACTLCQGKLPGDPCCSLMPVLNWIAMKWCGKSHVNSTPPWLCPIGKSFPISLSIKKKKKRSLLWCFHLLQYYFIHTIELSVEPSSWPTPLDGKINQKWKWIQEKLNIGKCKWYFFIAMRSKETVAVPFCRKQSWSTLRNFLLSSKNRFAEWTF